MSAERGADREACGRDREEEQDAPSAPPGNAGCRPAQQDGDQRERRLTLQADTDNDACDERAGDPQGGRAHAKVARVSIPKALGIDWELEVGPWELTRKLPRASARGSFHQRLETKSDGELRDARVTRQAGDGRDVAAGDVPGRQTEVRLVEQVERVHAQRYGVARIEADETLHRQVEALETRAAQLVPHFVAKHT